MEGKHDNHFTTGVVEMYLIYFVRNGSGMYYYYHSETKSSFVRAWSILSKQLKTVIACGKELGWN